ncbi:polyprenyl synthetase family protein [Streptomyces sp. MNP-20]|uniref:polyprenyl synthetase family protein n=1 Tax=Streptomyces sp. MNP-20 TaxID=2721165 RepID=UPI0028161B4A|nr:polyprenyl synthetase family protein [Streptomyces sp. MNP-20]
MHPYAVTPSTASPADLLEAARVLLDTPLAHTAAALPRGMRAIIEYHLGLRDARGQAVVPRAAGKSLRPALVLAAAAAAGGRSEAALPAAVAVELVHDFTLLHDDIIDHNTVRRYRPTTWTVYGTAGAIVAGDALGAVALGLVADRPEAVRRLSACIVELAEGQYTDTCFETRTTVTLTEALAMAQGKTGALLGTACALGALHADAPAPVVKALDRFGREAGIAFQLVDDILGIWGGTRCHGQTRGSGHRRPQEVPPRRGRPALRHRCRKRARRPV